MVVSGLLLLCLGFASGVEPRSASLNQHTYPCGTAIPAFWLVPGTDAGPPAGIGSGPAPALRVAVECQAVRQRALKLAGGAIGLGCAVALLGCAALRGQAAPLVDVMAPRRPTTGG